jgi:uncharacterized Tic20 family protein
MKKINIVIGLLIVIILALGIIIINSKDSNEGKVYKYPTFKGQNGGGLYPDSQRLFNH